MRQSFSIVLIVLLTWQPLFKAGFFLYWKVNQSFIARSLCENREKVEMQCNGKCYLKKQLKKLDKTNSDTNRSAPAIINLKSLDLFVIPSLALNLVLDAVLLDIKHPICGIQDLLFGQQPLLFRPPEFG
jgi:hypothetical protein